MRALVFVICLSSVARADEESRVGWSFGTGTATALVSLAAGGALLAYRCDDSPKCDPAPWRRAGVHTMATGLALAPIFSHLIAREWKRAAWFGIAPAAFGILAIGLLEGMRPDDLLDSGAVTPRIVFAAALALELVASGIGLADSLMATDRLKKKKQPPPISLAPVIGPRLFGLTLGGFL
jgi:hypothetical protein